MSLQVVEYVSQEWLSCAGQGSKGVVICLDPALIPQPVSGTRSFIKGTIIGTTPYCNVVGAKEYRYRLQYETLHLLDPATPLACPDVQGILCEGCLTKFIEETANMAVLAGP